MDITDDNNGDLERSLWVKNRVFETKKVLKKDWPPFHCDKLRYAHADFF